MRQIDYISVSLILRGDELDPKVVSEKLRIKPTKSYRKGEKKTTPKSKLEYLTKIGLWSLDVHSDSRKVSDHISQLTSKINLDGAIMDSIPGINEAFVYVFIGAKADNSGDATLEFDVSRENVANLGRLGLSLQYVISLSDEENIEPSIRE